LISSLFSKNINEIKLNYSLKEAEREREREREREGKK